MYVTQERQAAVNATSTETQPGLLRTQCFSIRAWQDPSVYPDVLGMLAKRGLIPSRLHASNVDGRDELHIDFQVENITEATAQAVAQNLRRLILVDTVMRCEK